MTIDTFIPRGAVLLAPMAGVTDSTFRSICKSLGCDLTYTEMVSAKGMHYGGDNGRTRDLLHMTEAETPCGVQIFGSHPQIMSEQAEKICEEYSGKVALIDINMGCPAPKITGNGEGSALMKTPALASDIIKAVVKKISVPVTVKIRKGWDDNTVNCVDFAKMAQDCGVSALTIHGRTRMQFYTGKADWAAIERVANAIDIPVIGNGDVFCAADYSKMMSETGVHAVMIARGAQGNPWIFRDVDSLRRTVDILPDVSPMERIEMALYHAKECTLHKGDRAIVEMRKHIAWYITGMKDAAKIRAAVNSISNYEELETLLRDYGESILNSAS